MMTEAVVAGRWRRLLLGLIGVPMRWAAVQLLACRGVRVRCAAGSPTRGPLGLIPELILVLAWWRAQADRARLSAALPPGMADWWLTQPRCTAKTGWVTRSCHAIPEERARLQVAACKLGILILETPLPDTPDAPNGVVPRRFPG